jgi:hypothetical protein
MTASYRELAALADPIKAPVILDGEIAAPRAGRPDSGMLQSRMHLRYRRSGQLAYVPVQLPTTMLSSCLRPARRGNGPTGARAGGHRRSSDHNDIQPSPLRREG